MDETTEKLIGASLNEMAYRVKMLATAMLEAIDQLQGGEAKQKLQTALIALSNREKKHGLYPTAGENQKPDGVG